MSLSLSWQSAVASVPVALLEGALVMLPRAGGLRPLSRLRSPLWAALLPGSIIVGTFGLLIFPWAPTGVLLAAAVTTPLLAAAAVLLMVRARRLVLPIASAAGAAAALCTGGLGQLGISLVLALACLTVGVVLHRLIPSRWLFVGVFAMAAVDVALLGCSCGYRETAALAAASSRFHGPQFTAATVGTITIEYPDLCLAALLGACLAGKAAQRQAALILVALMVGYDSMLAPGVLLPATVPIAVTLLIVTVVPFWRRVVHRGLTSAVAHPGSPHVSHVQSRPRDRRVSDRRAPCVSSGARPQLKWSSRQRLGGGRRSVMHHSATDAHRSRRGAAREASPPWLARVRPIAPSGEDSSPHPT